MYEETTFESGLRLLTVEMPHAYSAAFGIWVGVGARYESERLAGASHFLEHMLFKGTERRPSAREIAQAIEGVGGVLNASTSHEVTTYWAKVAGIHLPHAVDTIFDMVRHSQFEPSELEKERQVIIEEINESLDLPEDLVYLQLGALLWPDHPLGRDIAGTRESVADLSREQLLNFMQNSYTPGNMVVSVASAIPHSVIRDLVAPFASGWSDHGKPSYLAVEPHSGPRAAVLHRENEQAHFCLAVRTFSREHPDRYALHLLNGILGDAMSSRLFIEIRERLGLAYTVYSSINLLKDTGSFLIYASVDPAKLTAAIRAVVDQLERVLEEGVSDEELRVAREYLKGRTLLRLEDTGANASWVGGQAVLGPEILTPEETIRRLDDVTLEDVQRVARDLLRHDRTALSVVGPVDPDADWANLIHLAGR